MNLAIPTIHLNGTSCKSLVKALVDAIRALSSAQDALDETAPHGRDYWPQGDAAYPQARREHHHRLQRLEDVRAELEHITMEIIG